MSIEKHLATFNNKKVEDFDPAKGIENLDTVYRLRTDYEQTPIEEIANAFLADPKVSEVEELIIGWWNSDGESDVGPEAITDILLAQKDKLPNLKYLMLGDITYDENEMSWITTGDISAFIASFPQLIHLQIRTGDEEPLDLGEFKSEHLKTLIFETGGLPKSSLKQLLEADLPNLEHLEIWLGARNYGYNCSLEHFAPLLEGGLFPKLKHLGLCNSEIQNQITEAVVNAPILDRIESLDLSRGNISDEGAQLLLDSPKIKALKHLNLDHHYLSDEMIENLTNLMGDKVNLSRNKSKDRYAESRYIEVSE